MKIYDISQEVFSCQVFADDPSPSKKAVRRIQRGDLYNLTEFSMCAHNGTHIDAPFHFLNDGKTVDEIPLEKTVGVCYVAEFDGLLSAKDAELILSKAQNADKESAKRILIKGNANITTSSAEVFAKAETFLIGIESQSFGDMDNPVDVHKILLGKEIVLLEGIRLEKVKEGTYFLNATPICLGGADGAPCRALLIETNR